jgi:DnaJ-class molecular chaperone
LKEALLGFEREITHLDDRKITVKRGIVTQPGDIIIIRGEGMPAHQSSEKGDLFVKVDIKFPQILTEKQIESKLNTNKFNNFIVAKLLFDKRSNW